MSKGRGPSHYNNHEDMDDYATSIHGMEEHYTDNGSSCHEYFIEHDIGNGSTCMGDMEFYNDNDFPCMEDFEAAYDIGPPSLEDMEHFNDHDGDSFMLQHDTMDEKENHQDVMTSTNKCYDPGGTTYYDSPPRSRRFHA